MRSMHRVDVTQEYVRERLDYDPDTGKLLWKPLKIDRMGWNRRWAGKEAGGLNAVGYVQISLSNGGDWCYRLLAHRVIWLYMMGEWPVEIDHINGDKADNRWCNLRDGSKSQNICNVPTWGHNKSGCKNVHWHRGAGKWVVEVKLNQKNQYFGLYADFDEACEVARKAREELHGEYANHGEA